MRSSKNFNSPPVRVWARVFVAAICGLCAMVSSGAQQPTSSGSRQVIRVWAYDGLSAQLLLWEGEYRNLHPEVRFENTLHGASAVMAGLYNGVADMALMGREIWPVETMAYQWVYQQPAFGVIVATAGLHAPGQLFTPVIIVNAKSPVDSVSLSQLDAIYGSDHRAAPANIRTWAELGVKGAWADKPIHPYGYGGEDALGVYFRHDVLHSDFKPNPDSHLLSDHNGGSVSAADRIGQAVATDPYAIGYTSLPAGSTTKVLTVEASSPVQPSNEALSNHQYPLTRSVWLYFRRVPDKPLESRVDGFVRFLLSPKAQALVGPSDELLPLTPDLEQKQLEKLDKPMPKTATAVEE